MAAVASTRAFNRSICFHSVHNSSVRARVQRPYVSSAAVSTTLRIHGCVQALQIAKVRANSTDPSYLCMYVNCKLRHLNDARPTFVGQQLERQGARGFKHEARGHMVQARPSRA
jgi:hypothetical protein